MKEKVKSALDQNLHAEAGRLAQLPREDQAAVVVMYRRLAGNSLATKACRDSAKQRAAALEKLLGLERPRKPAAGPKGTKTGKPSKARGKR